MAEPQQTVAPAPAAAPAEKQHQPKAPKASKKKEVEFNLKTPKGTRDYAAKEMATRESCISMIKECFKRHGAVTIDTPVFELRETLMGKYGEDSKLIYDLQDQGGELCSLRYDLTVPFARYVAMNKIRTIKRYQIAKVYRRDNPAMTMGRYREFYQCDCDIAGTYDLMIPDSECLAMLCEILTEAHIGDFAIKINHRKLLDGIFDICGVPKEKFHPICSAVDKLDKLPWEEVCKEMTEVKGLDPAIAEQIRTFVTLSGKPHEMLRQLRESGRCESSAVAKSALDELEVLFSYTDAYNVTDRLVFDLSLVRGLDYYTGIVFEGVLRGAKVGSIAGGGRYDNLVGIFGSEQIPAVGFSVGLERLFAIAEGMLKEAKIEARESETEVFVVSLCKDGALTERMRLCSELWAAGIKAELLPKIKAKAPPQLREAEQIGAPLAIIFGEDELTKGTVMLKDMRNKTQGPVDRKDIVVAVRRALNAPDATPEDPSAAPLEVGGHKLVRVTFKRQCSCVMCHKPITGIILHGYVCSVCQQPFDLRCGPHASIVPCIPVQQQQQ
eukprot:m51a1_g5613 putative histidine-trna ligase (554) ;mRNA; r:726394-728619